MTVDALTIDRATLRIRLPHSQLDRRSMVERVRELVFGEALEAALAGEGLLGEQLICIRSVAISLRLGPHEGERAWIDRWVGTLTRELQAILREGDPRRVVCYPSPSAALVDMARSVAREDLRRAWAWAQLGLSEPVRLERIDSAREELVRALVRRPELIVAVIGQLASTLVVAERVVRMIRPGRWIELASAALRVHGIIAAEHVLETDASEFVRDSSASMEARTSTETLARSPIAALVRSELALERGQDARSRARALAVLALLDAAPMRGRRVLSERGGLERAIAGLVPGIEASTSEQAQVRGERTSARGREASARESTPERSASEPRPSVRAAPADRDEPHERTSTAASVNPCSPLELEPWRDEPLDARTRRFSEWAGLLLLIAVLRRESSFVELDALADAFALDFRTVLHALGRTLMPAAITDDDPALLAFVGLPPDAEPPARPHDAARERRLVARLVGVRARLIAALEARLPARPHRPVRGDALLAWLLRRRGELIGERGWLELRLRLRDVDTDIRRAGLDLDPDWVPELGVVVRFVYA